MVIPAVITLMPHMSALLDNIKNQYFKQVERSACLQVSLLLDHRDCQKLTTHWEHCKSPPISQHLFNSIEKLLRFQPIQLREAFKIEKRV